MKIAIYFIIVILFVVLLFWTWNNSREFQENTDKIKFILIGLMVLSLITWIIFNLSKIGIQYPNEDIMKELRKISVLLFIPINGFLSLPHMASIKSELNQVTRDDEKIKRKIIILGIVLILAIIIEILYLNDFQNGIIEMLNV